MVLSSQEKNLFIPWNNTSVSGKNGNVMRRLDTEWRKSRGGGKESAML